MASLPNRILRLLVEKPATMTPDSTTTYFAAYRADYVCQTITRLQRLGLVVTDEQGRMTCTQQGQATAALVKPARWSASRFIRDRRAPTDRPQAHQARNKVDA